MNMSLVIITTAALKSQADACLAALGWGAQNFLVELGPDPTGNATHYGLRAMVTTEFLGELQDNIAADPALGSAVLFDVRPDAERMGHFDAVLAKAELKRIAPPHVD